MELRAYLKRLSPEERADFALRVGATLGHLANTSYGSRRPSAALTRQIAQATGRVVAEWDLRPHDWHLIWPELKALPDAPLLPDLVRPQAGREVTHGFA